MGFSELSSMYFDFLGNALKFDFQVMSKWWMYAPLLIPIICYAVFFVIKWFFLTMPAWLPVVIILSTINRIRHPELAQANDATPAPNPVSKPTPAPAIKRPNVPFPQVVGKSILPRDDSAPQYGRVIAGEIIEEPIAVVSEDPLDALAQLADEAAADEARGRAFADKLMGKGKRVKENDERVS